VRAIVNGNFIHITDFKERNTDIKKDIKETLEVLVSNVDKEEKDIGVFSHKVISEVEKIRNQFAKTNNELLIGEFNDVMRTWYKKNEQWKYQIESNMTGVIVCKFGDVFDCKKYRKHFKDDIDVIHEMDKIYNADKNTDQVVRTIYNNILDEDELYEVEKDVKEDNFLNKCDSAIYNVQQSSDEIRDNLIFVRDEIKLSSVQLVEILDCREQGIYIQ